MDIGAIMKHSNFRKWVDEQYQENRDEREAFHEHPISVKEYWSNAKWFLKYKFKFLRTHNE